MDIPLKAVELTGTVDERGQLRVNESLETVRPGPVRVLLLFPEEDLDEREWLQAASRNPAFDFLNDPSEDIYTGADGRPFHDEG